MSFTYDPILNLALASDEDESHGPQMRQNLSALAQVAAPSNCYFVSPSYTEDNIHNAAATSRRHFSTIQAALNAITTGSTLGDLATIKVEPGPYPENITITKSCAIVAEGGRCSKGLGAGRGVWLSGANNQSPLVTITPPNGSSMSVVLNGLHLENLYNGTAGVIANAQILKVNPQSTFGGNPNYISVVDCGIRAQTWGSGNDWLAGIWAHGYNIVNIEGGTICALSYAGGSGIGGIAYPVMLMGDNGNSKPASGQITNVKFYQAYTGAQSATTALFYLDGGASLKVAQCPLFRQRAYAWLGAIGTNVIDGIGTDLVNGTPATAAGWGNLLNINVGGL